MRCSNCGLPLSPSRTSCPRCGTIYNGSARKVGSEQNVVPPQVSAFIPGEMPAGLDKKPRHIGAEVPRAQWNAYAAPVFDHGPTGYAGQAAMDREQAASLPVSVNEHAFFDPSPAMSQPISYQNPQQSGSPATSPQITSASSGWTPMPAASVRPLLLVTDTPGTRQGNLRMMRTGFTLASICLILATLILIFVSIMAQPLLSSDASSSRSVQKNARNTFTIKSTPSLTLPTPTPTETLPGVQYINNARMASEVNETTGGVILYATNFKVNQRIYVTFALSTGNQGGAACFRWYLNNQYLQNDDYAFVLEKNQFYNSFSYAQMYTSGSGYVEVYWASTKACTDKLLAQRVNFVVS